MGQVSHDVLRIIAFQEGDSWIAQCLEYDISAQASDLDELSARIDATIDAERAYTVSQGRKPFEGIDPAPQHFHVMWDKRSAFTTNLPNVDRAERIELALCA